MTHKWTALQVSVLFVMCVNVAFSDGNKRGNPGGIKGGGAYMPQGGGTPKSMPKGGSYGNKTGGSFGNKGGGSFGNKGGGSFGNKGGGGFGGGQIKGSVQNKTGAGQTGKEGGFPPSGVSGQKTTLKSGRKQLGAGKDNDDGSRVRGRGRKGLGGGQKTDLEKKNPDNSPPATVGLPK